MEESDWLWFNQEQNAALQSSESQSGQLGGGQSQSLRPQAQVENQEQLQQQTQTQQGASAEQTANRRRLALWIWLMILLLLLLAAVVYLILRRKAVLKKRDEAFSQDDHRAASAALFAHSMQMMWASGLPRENIPVECMQQAADAWRGDAEFAQAAQIHTLARYSSHEITPAQRDVLLQFERQAQQKFIGKLRWYQKLYQKWIRCMY